MVDPAQKMEPLFQAVSRDDPEFATAHAHAAATIDTFRSRLDSRAAQVCACKLRFRDPDASDECGEDYFLYLWLGLAAYHPDELLFSATFMEVPQSFRKWHDVGQRLAFAAEDIFDWLVIEDGWLYGGFTLRVTRSRLPENQRFDYDRRLGVQKWAPVP